jgi:ADP-ribosylglycohydrolase
MRHYLCLAIARKQGRILPDDYAAVLIERMNPWRVWRSDRIALEKLKLGMNPWETGKQNMPNGAAAMAIAPVGIINAGDPEQAYKDGFIIASVTQDGVDRDAAAVVAAAVAAALAPDANVESVLAAATAHASFLIRRAVNLAVDAARETGDIPAFTEWFYERMLHWHATKQVQMGEWDKDHFFSGSSLEMVPAVMALFYLCGGDVNRCIVEGVNFGRDNDTIASVAANISGALQGASMIRREWIDTVEKANAPFFAEVCDDADANFLVMSRRLQDALMAEQRAQQQRLGRLNQILGVD